MNVVIVLVSHIRRQAFDRPGKLQQIVERRLFLLRRWYHYFDSRAVGERRRLVEHDDAVSVCSCESHSYLTCQRHPLFYITGDECPNRR